MLKRKYAKEHSTTYKVGGLGLEIVRRVSKNFWQALSGALGKICVIALHS